MNGQYSGQATLINTVNGGTMHATKLILISMNLLTLKHEKQKIIIFLGDFMTEIEMIREVVKQPCPTKSTMHMTWVVLMLLHLSIRSNRRKKLFSTFWTF